MGLFGSKKPDANKAAPGSARKTVVEAPQSTRKSVRRVVPSARGQVPAPAKPQPTQRHQPGQAPRPTAAPNESMVEEIQPLPAANEPERLDLGSGLHSSVPASAPTPARGSGTKPIRASTAPDFAGSLGAARSAGPSRTGDQVLYEFLTGKVALLTAEQAIAVRAKADSEAIPLDESAVRMGVLTEEQLVNSLSQETWVPHLKVDKYEIRKKALDTISREDAQHFGVFPVDKLGNLLTLAMVNPLDAEAIRQLEAKTGLDIKKVVATRSEVAAAIDKYYGGKVQASEGSRSFEQEVPAQPKSATQMLSRGIDTPELAPLPMPPAAFERTPAKPAANITPDISADIQDIDDLLGGEETIAPAIIEPVSIKPGREQRRPRTHRCADHPGDPPHRKRAGVRTPRGAQGGHRRPGAQRARGAVARSRGRPTRSCRRPRQLRRPCRPHRRPAPRAAATCAARPPASLPATSAAR